MKNEKNIKYGLFASILIALGPILWLFINIYDKNYKPLTFNIMCVILGLALVFFYLRNYLEVYTKKEKRKLGLVKHVISFIFYILLIAAMVIAFIGLYILIAIIQKALFVKGEYLTYLIKSPYSYLLFLVLLIVVNKVKILVSKEEEKFKDKKDFALWKKIDRVLMISIIPMLYIVITSVVVVTEDGIYDYSFYNLKGNKYSFSEVEYVETGFGTKGRSRGEFFYNIKLENGKKFKLAHPSMPQPSEKYNNDTWQEYIDIDKYIMNSGAKKKSSEKGSNYVMMEQIYIDKLLEVVRNK